MTRKVILLAILVITAAIQFIRPSMTRTSEVSSTDITRVMNVPDSIKSILHAACYDCHSNNTTYPWYSYVQPVGWFLNSHIKEGRSGLNFSDFGSYSPDRKANKFEEIGEHISENSMPLMSYKLLHKAARLSETERQTLIKWAEKSRKSISD